MFDRRWMRLLAIVGAGAIAGLIALHVGGLAAPAPTGLALSCGDVTYWFDWWTGGQWEISTCPGFQVSMMATPTGFTSIPVPVAVIGALVAVVGAFEIRYRRRGIEWL